MTPAIKLLKKKNIEFKLHPYQVDPSCQSYGEEAADALGVDRIRLFKTLIVEADQQPDNLYVALIPVSQQLDMKHLAKLFQLKKARMAQPADVERKTGYILGGVSPLAQKRSYKTVVHRSILDHATVFVSAGKRGLQIELSPKELILLTHAQTDDIARKS